MCESLCKRTPTGNKNRLKMPRHAALKKMRENPMGRKPDPLSGERANNVINYLSFVVVARVFRTGHQILKMNLVCSETYLSN